MVISIEKKKSEMNVDIDCVFGLFSHWSMIFYIGWDKMKFLRVFVRPLWISPQVYHRYINELPISSGKLAHLAYDN